MRWGSERLPRPPSRHQRSAIFSGSCVFLYHPGRTLGRKPARLQNPRAGSPASEGTDVYLLARMASFSRIKESSMVGEPSLRRSRLSGLGTRHLWTPVHRRAAKSTRLTERQLLIPGPSAKECASCRSACSCRLLRGGKSENSIRSGDLSPRLENTTTSPTSQAAFRRGFN